MYLLLVDIYVFFPIIRLLTNLGAPFSDSNPWRRLINSIDSTIMLTNCTVIFSRVHGSEINWTLLILMATYFFHVYRKFVRVFRSLRFLIAENGQISSSVSDILLLILFLVIFVSFWGCWKLWSLCQTFQIKTFNLADQVPGFWPVDIVFVYGSKNCSKNPSLVE